MQTLSNLTNHMTGQSYDVKKILDEFDKPLFRNKFYINKNYLIEQSDYIKFNNDKWIYKPQLFCQDYYEEQYLYPVILLINNINSIFNFHPNNLMNQLINAPNKQIIYNILY
jgi:hypothetical protein